MNQMMDREARDHYIEAPKVGQGGIHVVLDDLDLWITGEIFPSLIQHGRREVDADSFDMRVSLFHERQQAPVASTKIQNALNTGWNNLQNDRFAFSTMGNGINALLQILKRVFRCRPKIYIHFVTLGTDSALPLLMLL